MNKRYLIAMGFLGVLGIAGFVYVISGNDGSPEGVGDFATTRSALPTRERPDASRAALKWGPLTDDSIPREARLELARSIRGDLQPGEVDFLFAVMRHEPKAGNPEEWWVVMNEIMEQMRKHGAGADRYTAELVSLVRDADSHEVVKDYAIQHLSQWLAPAPTGLAPGETDPAARDKALNVISEAVRNPGYAHGSIPGTALMALADISTRLPDEVVEPVWKELSPHFAQVISGQSAAGIPFRISVIQAAGMRRLPEHLPAIREMAASESAAPSLRLTSIASLGFYGQPEDLPFLREVALGGSKFQYAARSAMQRIENP